MKARAGLTNRFGGRSAAPVDQTSLIHRMEKRVDVFEADAS